MTDHTPTPWDYVPSTEHHGPYITSNYGGTIADLYLMSEPGALSTRNGGTSKPVHFFHEMADPNAAFIVKACNSHETLVKALNDIRAFPYIGEKAAQQMALIAGEALALMAADLSPTGEA